MKKQLKSKEHLPSTFKVINTFNNPEYIEPLQNYCSQITGLRHSNYINLKIRQALNWYILYDGSWIVGFSGIHQSSYFKENKIARIMYRTYLAPEIRMTGMTIGRINWKLSGHDQIKFCLDNGLTPIISRENPKSINNICKHANHTSTYEWKVSSGFYWTCNNRPDTSQNCWQKVVVCDNHKVMKGIPNISDKQYENLFR